jgi:zinc/manganese transport system substrate-binding protein
MQKNCNSARFSHFSCMKFAIAALLLAGLTAVRADGELAVASLSTVLTDVARNVGGSKITVAEIVKPGVDPHDFQPSPGDIKALSKAKIVLASGLGFESYLDKLRASVGSGPVFVVVGEKITPLMVEEGAAHEHEGHDHKGHDYSHGKGGKVPDPHWWHSIANVKTAARVLRDAFSAADPGNRAFYETNAKAYLARLDDLAKWTKIQIARLPKDRRVLVTSHDALGYFARDYGFEIHPVEGISSGEQPSSKRVRELIEEIKAEGVKAIFAENVENPKVLGEITKETGATSGGTLYADGLGAREANTYEAMMRHNVETIVKGLE